MLNLVGDHYYFIFPGYGPQFRDMSLWLAHWERVFPGEHRFWPGFSGGGILAIPLEMPARVRTKLALMDFACHHKPVRGLVLGNEAGQKLGSSLSCALSDRPPGWVVWLGLAEHVPDPTVKTTAESADGLDDGRRYLLVVPRARRRSLKLMDQLSSWFDPFGVSVDPSSAEVPPALRAAMGDWFGDPGRPMFAFSMAGGEDNAAWQLAVAYYIAEYWDTRASGLDSIHIAADIAGKPSFRKNWTSNK